MNKADRNSILQIVESLKDDKTGWDEITSAVNEQLSTKHGSEAIRSLWRRKGTLQRDRSDSTVTEDVATLIQTQKRTPEDMTSGEWFDALDSAQSVRKKVSIRELLTTKRIVTDKPIAVTFSSDWHIGSQYCNYKALREDNEIIKNDPRIFACLGGDPTDNFPQGFRDASAPASALEPPQIQKLIWEQILIEMEPSIIAVIGGNHNRMDQKKSGMDTDYFILRDKKFSFLPQGGVIKLTVGKIEYEILWKHHYRFNSSLNKFNTHHRMYEILLPTADVVVTEHEHSPGIESIERGEYDQRKTIINIRTGSYKGADPYSMDYFQAGMRGPQTVIFWPDKKKVSAIHGADALRDAQIFLDGLYG